MIPNYYLLVFLVLQLLVLNVTAREPKNLAKPPCQSSCGNVTIPFPFGIGSDCYLHRNFEIDCHNNKPTLSSINGSEVLGISVENQTMRINHPVFHICQDVQRSDNLTVNLSATPFFFSPEKNMFTGLGCRNIVYMWYADSDHEDGYYLGGCYSVCHKMKNYATSGDAHSSCNGINCCQTGIIPSFQVFNITIQENDFIYNGGSKAADEQQECRYAFLVEQNWFADHRYEVANMTHVPVVLDWRIDEPSYSRLSTASENSPHASCQKSVLYNNTAYCKCHQGFEGNPYLHDGCKVFMVSEPLMANDTTQQSNPTSAHSTPMEFPAAVNMQTTPTVPVTNNSGFSSIQVPNLFSNSVTVKLDGSNFLLWRQQALATIRGHGMTDFISYPSSAPSEFTSDGFISVEYQIWDQKDQQLLSWLLGSVNSEFLNHVVGCNTSFEVWSTLENIFQTKSKANILQYKIELQSVKKGSLKVTDYLLKIKKLVDALIYSGSIVTEEDHISYILSGLGPDYNALVVSVTSRKDCYSVGEICSLLVANEKLLEKQAIQLSESFNANLTIGSNSNQQRKFGNSYSGGYSRSVNVAGNRGQNYYNSNRGNSSTNRGRGRGRSNFNRPQCQLCGRFGHTVFKCYHRFDQNFQQPQSSSMNAMVATTETFSDPAWFVDSGATNHCTPAADNLHCRIPYSGQEKLVVGNGTGLEINAIDQGNTAPGQN